MRYTTYHCGKAVIKDKNELSEAMQKLAKLEDAEELRTNFEETSKWIPCSEKMPKNEQEVEISCKRTYLGAGDEKRTAYFTARAFYTDGTMNTEDSDFCWEYACDWEYDEEKDAYIIPEGWWEYVVFSESFAAVDAEVVAWMPLPESYKEG